MRRLPRGQALHAQLFTGFKALQHICYAWIMARLFQIGLKDIPRRVPFAPFCQKAGISVRGRGDQRAIRRKNLKCFKRFLILPAGDFHQGERIEHDAAQIGIFSGRIHQLQLGLGKIAKSELCPGLQRAEHHGVKRSGLAARGQITHSQKVFRGDGVSREGQPQQAGFVKDGLARLRGYRQGERKVVGEERREDRPLGDRPVARMNTGNAGIVFSGRLRVIRQRKRPRRQGRSPPAASSCMPKAGP